MWLKIKRHLHHESTNLYNLSSRAVEGTLGVTGLAARIATNSNLTVNDPGSTRGSRVGDGGSPSRTFRLSGLFYFLWCPAPLGQPPRIFGNSFRTSALAASARRSS